MLLPAPLIADSICRIVVAIAMLGWFGASAAFAQLDPKPLLNPEQFKQGKGDYNLRTSTALKSINPGASEIADLKKGAKFVIYRQTLKSEQDALSKNVQRLLTDTANTQATAPARAEFFKELVKVAPDVLNDPEQPLIAKIQVVLILSNLYVKQQGQGGRPPVPFTGQFKDLAKILLNSENSLPVRLEAAVGLVRIAKDYEAGTTGGDLTVNERSDIADAFVEALKSPSLQGAENNSWWIRYRCAEGLGVVGMTTNVTKRVVFADFLLDMLRNPKEDFRARARAAHSLSMLEYSVGSNLDIAVFETVKLHRDLLAAYNKNPAIPGFRKAAEEVYLSFRPEVVAQQNLFQGFMFQHKRWAGGSKTLQAAAEAGYKAILPLSQDTLGAGGKLKTKYSVEAHEDFLKKNAPTSNKLVPESRGATNKTIDPQPMAAAGP